MKQRWFAAAAAAALLGLAAPNAALAQTPTTVRPAVANRYYDLLCHTPFGDAHAHAFTTLYSDGSQALNEWHYVTNPPFQADRVELRYLQTATGQEGLLAAAGKSADTPEDVDAEFTNEYKNAPAIPADPSHLNFDMFVYVYGGGDNPYGCIGVLHTL